MQIMLPVIFFFVFFTNNLQNEFQNNLCVPSSDLRSEELNIYFREKIEPKRGRERK